MSIRGTVTAYVDVEVIEAIDREAERRGKTRTAVVRDALEKAVEIWKEASLVDKDTV